MESKIPLGEESVSDGICFCVGNDEGLFWLNLIDLMKEIMVMDSVDLTQTIL